MRRACLVPPLGSAPRCMRPRSASSGHPDEARSPVTAFVKVRINDTHDPLAKPAGTEVMQCSTLKKKKEKEKNVQRFGKWSSGALV